MPPEETAGWFLLGVLVSVFGVVFLSLAAAVFLDLYHELGMRGLAARAIVFVTFVTVSYFVGMGLSRI